MPTYYADAADAITLIIAYCLRYVMPMLTPPITLPPRYADYVTLSFRHYAAAIIVADLLRCLR